ncbi:MAG: threonine aldolase family protein [Thermoanaerobaculia bacterium]
MSAGSPDWKRQFASDNTAPVAPEAWEALERANREPSFTMGYGDDPVTRRAVALVREVFETDCDVYFVFNGSAANSLALASICNPYHGVICHPVSHAETDEANAPEFFTGGAKLIHVGGALGKLDPAGIPPLLRRGHGIHSAKPRAVTITQATELGTVYTPAEIRRITSIRARPEFADFRFHMDGARFANAVASTGAAPAELTWKAGIDVLSFGGTKNGGPGSEAIVFFDRELARDFEWRRKQGGQLASKMRYLAAPWVGMLENGAWLRHAARANACARRLAEALAAIDGVTLRVPVEANAVFVAFPDGVPEELERHGWHFYYFNDADAWRLMCSWNAGDEAIHAFVGDVREACAR